MLVDYQKCKYIYKTSLTRGVGIGKGIEPLKVEGKNEDRADGYHTSLTIYDEHRTSGERIGLPQFHPNHFETKNQNRLASPWIPLFRTRCGGY